MHGEVFSHVEDGFEDFDVLTLDLAALEHNGGIESLNLKLQAILFNGAKSSLVINGQSLHLGDEVEGARIVAIERGGVTLEKDGEQRKLILR